MLELIWIVVIGAVVGATAKFVMPGPAPGGFFVPALLGMGAALVANLLGRVLGLYGPNQGAGFGGALTSVLFNFIASVIGAIVVLLVYRNVRKRALARMGLATSRKEPWPRRQATTVNAPRKEYGMGILDELLGGGQPQRDFNDFVNRYEQGHPSEGYSDEEVIERYRDVAHAVPPGPVRAGSPGGPRAAVALASGSRSGSCLSMADSVAMTPPTDPTIAGGCR